MTNNTTTALTLADLGAIWPIPHQLLPKPECVHVGAFLIEMPHDRISINGIIAQANARLAELELDEPVDETEFDLDAELRRLDDLDAQQPQPVYETDWDLF
jgi:hypothetical protein